MEIRTTPIKIYWCPRWSKDDALFYWGKSWECAVWTLDKTKRIDIFSTRVQIGPIRIQLGYIQEAYWHGPVLREVPNDRI